MLAIAEEFIVFNKFNHDFSEVSLVYLNNVRGQGYGTVVDGLSTVTTFIYGGCASLIYISNVVKFTTVVEMKKNGILAFKIGQE